MRGMSQPSDRTDEQWDLLEPGVLGSTSGRGHGVSPGSYGCGADHGPKPPQQGNRHVVGLPNPLPASQPAAAAWRDPAVRPFDAAGPCGQARETTARKGGGGELHVGRADTGGDRVEEMGKERGRTASGFPPTEQAASPPWTGAALVAGATIPEPSDVPGGRAARADAPEVVATAHLCRSAASAAPGPAGRHQASKLPSRGHGCDALGARVRSPVARSRQRTSASSVRR